MPSSLVWPSIVGRVRTATVGITSAALFLLAPLFRWLGFQHGYGDSQLYYYSWFAYDGLALGALIAVVLRTKWATATAVARVATATLLVSSVLLAVGIPRGLLTRTTALGAAFEYTVVNLFFGSVLALSIVAGATRWKALVAPRWLVFCGYISYGLYLCHLLIFQTYDRVFGRIVDPTLGEMVRRFVIAGGVSVGIAWISRRYFEERFLRLKNRWDMKGPRPLGSRG